MFNEIVEKKLERIPVVYCCFGAGNIIKLESVQKVATKIIYPTDDFSYKKHLEGIDMPSINEFLKHFYKIFINTRFLVGYLLTTESPFATSSAHPGAEPQTTEVCKFL